MGTQTIAFAVAVVLAASLAARSSSAAVLVDRPRFQGLEIHTIPTMVQPSLFAAGPGTPPVAVVVQLDQSSIRILLRNGISPERCVGLSHGYLQLLHNTHQTMIARYAFCVEYARVEVRVCNPEFVPCWPNHYPRRYGKGVSHFVLSIV